MNNGLICLSSIEACLEYKGKGYIFFIPKFGDSMLSTGQRIMYERIVENLAKAGKCAVAAIVRHNIPQGTPIILKDCMVSSAKLGFNSWSEPNGPTTALGLLRWFTWMIDNNLPEALEKMQKGKNQSHTEAGQFQYEQEESYDDTSEEALY